MKKGMLGLAILLIILAPTSIVYAGTLNSYEMQVISAAKQIYVYNGEQYQVDDSYINQLISYLSSDGIDLNEDQEKEILQMSFSNVEEGIKEGYLIPITDQTKSPGVGNDISVDDKDKDGTDNTPTPKTTNINQNTNHTSNNQNTNNQQNSSTPQDTIGNILTGGQNQNTSTDVTGTSESNGLIIKATGIDLKNTVIMITGMGLLMLIGIFVTVKFNLFAHRNE